jgi:hypothetical protein
MFNAEALDAHLLREADKHYEREDAVTVESLKQQYFDERMDALADDDILGGLQWACSAHCSDIREAYHDDAQLARRVRSLIRCYVEIDAREQATKELAAHH